VRGRLGSFCLSYWKGSKPFKLCAADLLLSFFKVKIIKSGKCYIKLKMLCIDLSLKYKGIQWVPLAESGWWNVLCQ